MGRDAFFALEKEINQLLDEFLSTFFLSFSNCKENQLRSQQELIERLLVPVIPISVSICIVPLNGNSETLRI